MIWYLLWLSVPVFVSSASVNISICRKGSTTIAPTLEVHQGCSQYYMPFCVCLSVYGWRLSLLMTLEEERVDSEAVQLCLARPWGLRGSRRKFKFDQTQSLTQR